MRGLLWLLTLGALAVGLALAAHYNEGYALLVLPPWRVDLSLNLLIVLEVAAFFVLYLFIRTTARTLRLPQTVREYRLRRRHRQAERALGNALRFSYEGRYGHALKQATAAYAARHMPGLSALVAARAAHALHEDEREAEWLAAAAEHDQECHIARLMSEAELHLDARRYADAQAALDLLAAGGQRHIAALRFALRAQQGLGNWREVLRLTRQLEKHKALTADQAAPLKLRTHQENLRALSLDAAALASYWRDVSAAERRSPRLAAVAAKLFIAADDCETARGVIENALASEWDSTLAAVYADCQGGDVLGRIAQAELWLKRQPRDAQLLLALGRLCQQQELWGKAQSYLEASLSVAPSRAAHIELAQLLDHLGHTGEADRHFRAAAVI